MDGAGVKTRSSRWPLWLLAGSLVVAQPALADFMAALSAYQRGDYTAAARAAQPAAEAGDADAQLLLGDLYAAGQGVRQDPVVAYRWYDRAAARGLAPASKARERLAATMSAGQLAAARGERGTNAAAVDPAEVQRLLNGLGYDAGPVDGQPGPRTARAVQAFQRDVGMPADGQITAALEAALRRRAAGGVASAPVTLAASMVTAAETPLLAGPDSGAARVGVLPAGARVLTAEQRGSWARVRALPPASGVGWVDGHALAPDDSGAPLPAAEGAPSTAAQGGDGGGFFSGLARGVSGLFGAGAGQSQASGGATATIGIRGFDTSQLAAGRPNAAEFARLQDYAVAPEEAGRFAAEIGLRAARVAYLPEPERVTVGASSSPRRKE